VAAYKPVETPDSAKRELAPELVEREIAHLEAELAIT
jgi:hypothetical protein